MTADNCPTRTIADGRYLCAIFGTDFSLDPAQVPLRLIVATAPGTAGTSPAAGSHPVDRHPYELVNYGASAPGQWRFAFWHEDVNAGVTNGGSRRTIKFDAGDLIISYGQDFTNFADSPFAPGRFTPLRIRYDTTIIDATSCAAHFHNDDPLIHHYECQIRGAFNPDTPIPTEITVSLAPTATTAATGTTRPSDPGGTSDDPATTPTTCTTAPTQTCQPTDNNS